MKSRLKLLAFAVALGSFSGLWAKENANTPGSSNSAASPAPKNIGASCAPASAQTDLAVNNVRTRILAGGDMWWDLMNGIYEIPRESSKHSMFAGALWIGGQDVGDQLKVAAMTYRQEGSDFWPGPLDAATASVDDTICAEFDEHYQITRQQVEDYVSWLNGTNDDPNYTVPSVILEWPGNYPDTYSQFGAEPLAPFFDADGDGFYDPAVGDYPAYDLSGEADCQGADLLFGDQTLWWVFNDKGNIHSETNAEPIGLEIQAQAFAFATNDEINNMTFYSYKIVNRASFVLKNTYFGQWVDPDLGKYDDDYVGCDVGRGLGFCYNGDEDDEGATGYGLNPPSIGVDFFRGPLADPGDGIDNDRDGTVDEIGEQIIMSKFVYYENVRDLPTGNPIQAFHFYNYLRGIWKDNTGMVHNGANGHGPTTGPGPPTDFMFPGDTNPDFPGDDWTEHSAGNDEGDRRFLQSAGSFTLQPGAVNYITTGVVWARATTGGRLASVELMRLADDKAQALFDNCFKVLDGPDAPTMNIQELDRKLILMLSNSENSNNFNEEYEELDPLIIGFDDTTYVFEGYQIFQLKDATVSVTDIYNPDLARRVAQCDIANGVTTLINYETDPSLGVPVPQEMTLGANDDGTQKSFLITEDAFATGDPTLVNHKPYYYTVIAYAYNEFKLYNPTDPNGLDGQTKPYKAGRRNITTYVGIPHITSPEASGTIQQAEYGDGPELTRIEGTGNCGNILEFKAETAEDIVMNYTMDNPVYENGQGPVQIKVVDPLSVPTGDYRIVFSGANASATWYIVRLPDGSPENTIWSNGTIEIEKEQLLVNSAGEFWGMSIAAVDAENPGDNPTEGNGFLGADMVFEDNTKAWLTGVGDFDGDPRFNWIRSGTNNTGNYPDKPGDDEGVFEDVLGGTWAPYRLVSNDVVTTNTPDGSGPGWEGPFQALSRLESLNSVDVVLTSDKSLWTRVPVLEAQDQTDLAQGGAEKLNFRAAPSVDKDGNPDASGSTGWGWFPGYALDLEKGVRLNIMFAEDSWQSGQNGNDMLFNPTSTEINTLGQVAFGGKHFLYIMNSEYQGELAPYMGDDETMNPYYDALNDPTNVNKRQVFAACTWVSIPLLEPGQDLLATDVTVKLRVSKEYDAYEIDGSNSGNPVYQFNTDDVATITNDNNTAENALSIVRVVPNPYYAYSAYETNQLDNRVKITNLPPRCVVSVYTTNGALVRRFNKDNPSTFIEWDLKNTNAVPIASGMYVIHVKAEGIGETFVKWFGSMRPVDLDTF
ncbi:MAG: T9SS C-terminal target domain-containing protein [Flavobacteriales bacterium]|nr:T9SS C-terminal target domain-containing protein [Flavobacteriales bacterium]